jgi:hypothetical protein
MRDANMDAMDSILAGSHPFIIPTASIEEYASPAPTVSTMDETWFVFV